MSTQNLGYWDSTLLATCLAAKHAVQEFIPVFSTHPESLPPPQSFWARPSRRTCQGPLLATGGAKHHLRWPAPCCTLAFPAKASQRVPWRWLPSPTPSNGTLIHAPLKPLHPGLQPSHSDSLPILRKPSSTVEGRGRPEADGPHLSNPEWSVCIPLAFNRFLVLAACLLGPALAIYQFCGGSIPWKTFIWYPVYIKH